MSKEFIQKRKGASSLEEASRQQSQLQYYLLSEIQENISEQYLQAFAERNFNTSDFFLNWVKNVLSIPNFLAFFKFYRHPIATTSLINDRIKEPLKRVFYADDSFFNYSIYGEDIECPEELDEAKFNEHIFNALLFKHNDLMFTDLSDVNKPFRMLIDIDKVVAIESHDSEIYRVAFEAYDEEGNQGYLYCDEEKYSFYNRDLVLLNESPHDLGKCPVNYISAEPFSNDDIVRKSIFSHSIENFEKYVFLKTLQRMGEVNGVMPVATVLQTEEDNESYRDNKGQYSGEPMASNEIGGQKSQEFQRTVHGKNSPLNAGTKIEVPVIKKSDGSIDTDIVQNFINFFYLPVDAQEFLNTRIKEVEQSIIVNILGDYQEGNEQAQNELQVSKSYVGKQDKLRGLSLQLSRIRNLSDFDFLALKYGKDNVYVDCFYGSDFFIETEQDLLEQVQNAPNPIERRHIYLRLAKNRGKFSKSNETKDYILYSLLPYTSDDEFKEVKDLASRDVIELQTRFNYWINSFEAKYGELVSFWLGLEDMQKGEKLTIITNLIMEMIRESLPSVNESDNIGIDDENTNIDNQEGQGIDAESEAQARLKGSVGGVQGILEIQASVASGATQYDAALIVLKEIYGFDDSIAKAILGKKPSPRDIKAKQEQNMNNNNSITN